MKILYPIIDGQVSGGNIICLRFIEAAKRKGWDVFVNSPTKGDFIDMIRDKCAGIFYVDTRRSFRFDKSMELAKIIKKEGIDLVHTHTPLPDGNLCRIASALAGVPIITHAHIRLPVSPNPIIRKYQLMLDWITSRLFCDKIIAVSEAVKADFIKQASPSHKIDVIYNGIDLESNQPQKSSMDVRKEFGLANEHILIGEVARLCNVKGQHVLIESIGSVIGEFPDTIFMIVGEDIEKNGEYRIKLENLAKELNVDKNIIFTGYRSDIPDLMNAFDIFVLPSFAEGLPVTILEAMAAKKAVIATPVGGNTEIVVDGETGIIVPVGDHEQLAKAIMSLLQNPELAQQMGQKGYERVRDHFSLEQMIDKTFSIYEEVMRK